MNRNYVFAIAILALSLAASAASGAQEHVPRRYRLLCNSLTVSKNDDVTEIALSGGVKLYGRDGRSIKSESGLIKVASAVIERAAQSGKSTAKNEVAGSKDARGASEAVLPAPQIKPEDVKLIELSGGVVMKDAQGTLTCDTVYSTDGGRTWLTRGKSNFEGAGKNKGTRLSAASLEFNSAKNTLAGKGGVHISMPGKAAAGGAGGGKTPVEVNAGSFTYNIGTSELTLKGGVTSSSPQGTIDAQHAEYSSASGGLSATGGVTVVFREKNVSAGADSARYSGGGAAVFTGNVVVIDGKSGARITCDKLDYNAESGEVTAAGNARLQYPKEKIALTADKIAGNLEKKTGVATGNPKVKRGASTAAGHEIRFRMEGGKAVVEVKGGGDTEYVIFPEELELAK